MAGPKEFDRELSGSSRQAWRQPWPAALDWAGRLGQRPSDKKATKLLAPGRGRAFELTRWVQHRAQQEMVMHTAKRAGIQAN